MTGYVGLSWQGGSYCHSVRRTHLGLEGTHPGSPVSQRLGGEEASREGSSFTVPGF